MATIAKANYQNVQFPSTAFAQLVELNTTERDIVIAFDGTASESVIIPDVAVQGITTPLTATLIVSFPIATTGSAVFDISVMAISGGDADNLSTGSSYASVNTSAAINAPASTNRAVSVTVTLTNNDSIAALDWVKIKIARNPASGGDTIATDCHLIAAIINDAR